MKIAVLLRGQLRFSEEGAHLFKKFVIDKFPQHEFEFFVSAPMRIYDFKTPAPKFNLINLTPSEAEEKIRYWPLTRRWSFQSERKLFDTIKKIVIELSNDNKLINWLSNHNEQYNRDTPIFDFSCPPLTDVPDGNYTIDFSYDPVKIFYDSISEKNSLIFDKVDLFGDILEISQRMATKSTLYHNSALKNYTIELHNFISQYYSFIQSFKTLKDYISDYPAYKPDLVWSTRTDIFHIFNNRPDHFDILLKQLEVLENLSENDSSNKIITTNLIRIDNNQPYICDFNLFSTVTMLDNILNLDKQESTDIIFNAMIKNKTHFIKTNDAKYRVQHVLWSAFFNNVCFYQTAAPHMSSVIRQSFPLETILSMTGSDEDATLLKELSVAYKPMQANLNISVTDIINEFDYLSSH
jgi:hypothetical protein